MRMKCRLTTTSNSLTADKSMTDKHVCLLFDWSTQKSAIVTEPFFINTFTSYASSNRLQSVIGWSENLTQALIFVPSLVRDEQTSVWFHGNCR